MEVDFLLSWLIFEALSLVSTLPSGGCCLLGIPCSRLTSVQLPTVALRDRSRICTVLYVLPVSPGTWLLIVQQRRVVVATFERLGPSLEVWLLLEGL
jgi:hypothetical protein